MSINQAELKNIISNLSKLELTAEKEAKILNDANNILAYMDILNDVNTNNVEATVSVIKTRKNFREDINKKEYKPKDLLACSSQKIINNSIAVSAIM